MNFQNLARCMCFVVLWLVDSYATAQEDPCAVPGVPYTTHPDRPVRRSPLPKQEFDWREPQWPVFLETFGPSRGIVYSIPAPRPDSTTPAASALFHDLQMSPDSGWELLRADYGYDVYGTLSRVSTTIPLYLFYNKYSGTLRPMMYYTDVIPATHYLWNIQTRHYTTSVVVLDPLRRDAVDSNLYTRLSISAHRALRRTKPEYMHTWIADDFAVYYNPCPCKLDQDRLVLSPRLYRVTDIVVDGVPGTKQTGEFSLSDIILYIPGTDSTGRQHRPDLADWVPMYDAPLGTWTLLKTPQVQLSSTSLLQSGSNSPSVSVSIALQEPLLQSVNPYVFQRRPQISNKLAYLITIRGNVTPLHGLRRVSDSMYITNEIDASCANSEAYSLSFSALGPYEISSVGIALAPLLHTRSTLDSIRTTQDWLLFGATTVLTNQLVLQTDCAAVQQASEDQINRVCTTTEQASLSRRSRGSFLPALTTTMTDVQHNLVVMPLPASTVCDVHVDLDTDESITAVVVTDVIGRTLNVASNVPNHGTAVLIRLDVSALSAGAYLVHVSTTKRQHVSKLLIER